MALERVCLGIIVGTRGLKGELRIKSFTQDPADIVAYGPLEDRDGKRTFALTVTGEPSGRHKGVLFARVKGVGSLEEAEALKGTELYIPRAALPETDDEEFYHMDLIGLRADLAQGGVLGTVRAVEDYGAGTLLEIETDRDAPTRDKYVMVPFTRAAVPEVDIKGGRVTVDPPPGLLEPAKQGEEDQQDDEKDG
ncbi:MAG: ribosome maturation factor RimM [Rhodospirillales bacterium]